MDNNAKDNEFEELLNAYFPDEENPDESNEFVKHFDQEMKKTLVETAAKIEVEETWKREDSTTDNFWQNEYEKALFQAKEKDIQIVDLKKENEELRKEYETFYEKGAKSEILSFVFMLTLPLMTFGCIHLGDAISVGGLSFGFIGIYLLATVIFAVLAFVVLLPLLTLMVSKHGFGLERAYRNRQHWKLFLAACVFLIFAVLLITIRSKYD